MKLIYLASPYSENPEVNYKAVLEFVVWHYLSKTEVLFSPIIYGHIITNNGKMDSDFETWKNFDLLILSKSDELWVLK